MPRSGETCPVCYWCDVDLEHRFSRNERSKTTLLWAQRFFDEVGACDEEWLPLVRAATPDEARSPEWTTIDARRPVVATELERLITAAFADVRLDGGTTLREARERDNHGSRQEIALAALVRHERWQDVDEDTLEDCCDALAFLDARGYRFYLPAYLRYYARCLAATEEEKLVCDAHLGMAHRLWWHTLDANRHTEQYALLDDGQRSAIAVYLRALVEVDDYHESDAKEFLDAFWARYLPVA
jgi:hypothetical protein